MSSIQTVFGQEEANKLRNIDVKSEIFYFVTFRGKSKISTRLWLGYGTHWRVESARSCKLTSLEQALHDPVLTHNKR